MPYELTPSPETRFKRYHAKPYILNTFVAPYLETRKVENVYFKENRNWRAKNGMDSELKSPWHCSAETTGVTGGGCKWLHTLRKEMGVETRSPWAQLHAEALRV